jgi:hypothetical protein
MKVKFVLLFSVLANILFAQNVIVVVIDGARYSETFGGGNTFIPHLYDDLRPQGYLYTNFRIAHEGKTETNPGHASILSGTWQQISNDGLQRPTKPTTFEYFRKELGSSITDNYIIGGKAKLGILAYSNDPGYGVDYGASSSCADVSDNSVYNNLIYVMETYQPKQILVSFSDTDKRGHSGIWSSYVNALTNADNLVFQLWQHIEAGDYGYLPSNTTMFVTNDHGRHTTDFTGHGDNCDGCEHIMLFAIGRNVLPGVENSDLHYQIDLASTAGDLLNFSTPQSVGTSLYEGSNPLPVELFSFSANLIDNTVQLSWVTKTEVGNYGFEVFRRIKNGVWRKIGFVEGKGNSNAINFYTFIDETVTEGIVTYRLKQIDTDGKFKHSEIIEVNLGTLQKFELSQNYPNPFNPATTIKYLLPESGNVKLTVYNLLAEQVAEIVNEFKEAGVHTINFSAAGESASGGTAFRLESGVYIYKLEANGFVRSKKMTLIK